MSLGKWARKRLFPNWLLLLMFLPGFVYFLIFHYLPMAGVVIAFQRYSPWLGIRGSEWVGIQNFVDFFSSFYAWRVIRNTLALSLLTIIFAFPAPIVLAILLNEVRVKWFKRTVQTVTYMPYFLSNAIIAGIVVQILVSGGLLNGVRDALFGAEPIKFLEEPVYFRTIYVASHMWKRTGFSAIIYLAAIAGIDPELYQAATVDGATKLQKIRHITFPGIVPTAIILLLLSISDLLEVGIEMILLLYNPLIYETADVIGTFVYRRGLGGGDFTGTFRSAPQYGYGAAVGLFQSLVGIILVVAANRIAKSVSETSLW